MSSFHHVAFCQGFSLEDQDPIVEYYLADSRYHSLVKLEIHYGISLIVMFLLCIKFICFATSI